DEGGAGDHGRGLVDGDLATGDRDILLAEEELEGVRVLRLDQGEGVAHRVLGTDDLDDVTAPSLDLVVGGVDGLDETVFGHITGVEDRRGERGARVGGELGESPSVPDAAGHFGLAVENV